MAARRGGMSDVSLAGVRTPVFFFFFLQIKKKKKIGRKKSVGERESREWREDGLLRADDTSSITAPTNLVLILACAIDVITFFFLLYTPVFSRKRKKKRKKTFSPPYNRPSASHAKNRGGRKPLGSGKHTIAHKQKKEREKKREEGGQNIQPTKLKEEGTGQERGEAKSGRRKVRLALVASASPRCPVLP